MPSFQLMFDMEKERADPPLGPNMLGFWASSSRTASALVFS